MDISRSEYHTKPGASNVMHKIWKYPQDVIQCIRSRYCIDNLFIIYSFLKRNSIFKRNYGGTFDVSCIMFSNVFHLLLRVNDMESENVTLIRRSVSDGQKTSSSKGVSLIGV